MKIFAGIAILLSAIMALRYTALFSSNGNKAASIRGRRATNGANGGPSVVNGVFSYSDNHDGTFTCDIIGDSCEVSETHYLPEGQMAKTGKSYNSITDFCRIMLIKDFKGFYEIVTPEQGVCKLDAPNKISEHACFPEVCSNTALNKFTLERNLVLESGQRALQANLGGGDSSGSQNSSNNKDNSDSSDSSDGSVIKDGEDGSKSNDRDDRDDRDDREYVRNKTKFTVLVALIAITILAIGLLFSYWIIALVALIAITILAIGLFFFLLDKSKVTIPNLAASLIIFMICSFIFFLGSTLENDDWKVFDWFEESTAYTFFFAITIGVWLAAVNSYTRSPGIRARTDTGAGGSEGAATNEARGGDADTSTNGAGGATSTGGGDGGTAATDGSGSAAGGTIVVSRIYGGTMPN